MREDLDLIVQRVGRKGIGSASVFPVFAHCVVVKSIYVINDNYKYAKLSLNIIQKSGHL